MITVAAEAGIDLSRINSKDDYFYHAITEYREEFNAALREKRAFAEKRLSCIFGKRTGSRDYIADPIMSDFLILTSFLNDTARLRVYNAVSAQDISSTLPTDEYGKQRITSRDIQNLDPSMLGISNAQKYDKQKAMEAERARLKELGIQLDTKLARKALANIAKQYEGKILIVPSEIVHAVVQNLKPKESPAGAFTKG